MAREQPSVAYLGPKSSFTSQVAAEAFCESEFFLTPKPTILDVFNAVQSGAVDRGVVPFENSSNGPVLNALDLLADRLHQYPDTYIAGEVYLRINQCLLGHFQGHGQPSPPLTPTDKASSQHFEFASPDSFNHLNHIKHIYSHPQAFDQCESFLSKHLPKVIRHDVSSTAAAAHIAANDPNKASAAIGSATAAQQGLGITILANSIQDAQDNETRFLVLKRFTPTWHYEPSWIEEPPLKHHHGKHENQTDDDDKRKMLVSFSVQHSCPGALADALAIFEKYQLNLTLISARPSRKHAWHYRHFVEFEWRSPDEDGRECPVDGAVRDLSGVTRDWRCHGAWGSRLEW
jgi:prephenate dehydratase